jgi:hypothetical protein
MGGMMKSKRMFFAAALAGGLMMAASPVDAKNYFQLRNCNNVEVSVKFYVYNPNDSVDVVPYMTLSIPHGATEQGNCKSDKDKPFCKVEVADQDNEQFRAYDSATVYGSWDDYRSYRGLFDCDSEPAH